MKNTFFKKGFTLIELLIVITIIGILAVALLPSVLGAPARARDAARKADLNNIIGALEIFSSDKQRYPMASSGGDCVQDLTGTEDIQYTLQGGKAPSDPQGKGVKTCSAAPTTGNYLYCNLDGSPGSYLVAAQMEIQGDANTTVASLTGLGVCNGTGDAPALVAPTSANGPWAYVITK